MTSSKTIRKIFSVVMTIIMTVTLMPAFTLAASAMEGDGLDGPVITVEQGGDEQPPEGSEPPEGEEGPPGDTGDKGGTGDQGGTGDTGDQGGTGDGQAGIAPFGSISPFAVSETASNSGELAAAINAIKSAGGGIITLDANIEHNDNIEITNFDVTFALNGYTLDVIVAEGYALYVGSGGVVALTGVGEFNVESLNGIGLFVEDGGKAEVTNATGAGYESLGVYARNENTEVVVTGNATAFGEKSWGVLAWGEAKVSIGGNAEGGACGARAYLEGEIAVGGSVTSTDDDSTGASATDNGKITVDGDVTASGDNGMGVNAGENGIVEVAGNVTASGQKGIGINAYSDGVVEVTGNVTASGQEGAGIKTFDGIVTVDGDVTASGLDSRGVDAYGGIVEVGGNVTATAQDSEGIYANYWATVTVGGNVAGGAHGVHTGDNTVITVAKDVTAADMDGFGVEAWGGAEVTISGNVTGGACGVRASSEPYGFGGGFPPSYVTVGGNVNCFGPGMDSVGADVWGGSELTIDGDLTVTGHATYIRVDYYDKAKSDGNPNGSKAGYLEYTDDGSYVWVKDLRWDGEAATGFSGGSGTASDPYLIADGAELAYLAEVVNGNKTDTENGNSYNSAGKYYQLARNIYLNDSAGWEGWGAYADASAAETAGVNLWVPIAGSGSGFAANFDGGGFAVYGVYINTGSNNQGLFGQVNGGKIKNTGVEQSYIKGGSNAGGLAGSVTGNGSIVNCYNMGDVSGANNVGGIAGAVTGGSITNCYSAGSVSGSGASGGVAGYADYSANASYSYWLDGSAAQGIGGVNNGTVKDVLKFDADGVFDGNSPDDYVIIDSNIYETLLAALNAWKEYNPEKDYAPWYGEPLPTFRYVPVIPIVYDPGDVAIINNIIDKYRLGLEKADPADGTWIPDSWRGYMWWSDDETGKKVEELYLSGQDMSGALDLSGLVNLVYVDVSYNRLTSIDVSGLALEYFDCRMNFMESKSDVIGFSGKWDGEYYIFDPQCEDGVYHAGDIAVINKIIDDFGLDWDKAPENGKGVPYEWYYNMEWSDINKGKRVTELYLGYIGLDGAGKTLDVSGLSELLELHCQNNRLDAIDVRNLKKLRYLDCANNKLTKLDLTGCANLITLNCSRNKIGSDGNGVLNLTAQKKLVNIDCSYNDLTGINITNLNLNYLDCSYNVMTGKNKVVGFTKKWNGWQYVFDPQKRVVADVDAGDVAVINAIIAENGLDWTPASTPFTEAPADWTEVVWSKSSPKRIVQLDISGYAVGTSLENTLDVSGLSELEWLSCRYQYLDGLDVSGLAKLTGLDCGENMIEDLNLAGLENLTYLSCEYNELETLDVSGLTKLNGLFCDGNSLSALDVSGPEELRWLFCSDNDLMALDLSSQPSLISLYCDYNNIASLDVSGFKSLQWLSCNSNGLNSLNISGCASLSALYCDDNNLSALDVSGLTALEELLCRDNRLNSLTFKGNNKLRWVYCERNNITGLDLTGCPSLVELVCYDNRISEMNLSRQTKLEDLFASGNRLTTLDLSACAALTYLNCSDNSLTELNVAGLKNLVNLNCGDNELTALNVSGMTKLKELYCSFNRLTTLNLSGLNSLTDLSCYYNELTSLSVSGLKKLEYLYCSDNRLTTLNLTNATNLKYLYCGYNLLAKLDLRAQTKLVELHCQDNMLASLNVAGLTKLVELACQKNFLTDLNAGGLTSLRYLYCYDNELTKLTLTNSKNIEEIDCNLNKLEAINVTGLSNLEYFDCTGNYMTGEEKVTGVDNIPVFIDWGWSYYGPFQFHHQRVKGEMAEFNAKDIAAVNHIVKKHNLGWGQAPKDGDYMPSDWEYHVEWSGDPGDTDRRAIGLQFYGGELAGTLDVTGLTELEYLVCSGNALTGLNVAGLTKLNYLDCGGNRLTSLDVSGLTSLRSLSCYNNYLTTLTVTNLPKLEALYCDNNRLATLTVSNLPALEVLECGHNRLTSLNVTGHKALTQLYCSYNDMHPVEGDGPEHASVKGLVKESESDWIVKDSAAALDEFEFNPQNGHNEYAEMRKARAAVEKAVYVAAQAEAEDAAQAAEKVKEIAEGVIAKLDFMATAEPDFITVIVLDEDFKEAVAGTASRPMGTDGSFSFRLTLQAWGSTSGEVTTYELSLRIAATPMKLTGIYFAVPSGDPADSPAIQLGKGKHNLTTEYLVTVPYGVKLSGYDVKYNIVKGKAADLTATGALNAKAPGAVHVNVTVTDKVTKEAFTAATAVKVVTGLKSIKVNQGFDSLRKLALGKAFTPKITYAPANASIARVDWQSGNEAVAKVDPATGKVTAVGPGRAEITLKVWPFALDEYPYCDQDKGYFEWNYNIFVPATVVNIEKDSEIVNGQTLRLVPQGGDISVYPETFDLSAEAVVTASSPVEAVKWTNSNKSIASLVDNKDGTATVTGIKKGTVTLTATAAGGKKATVKVSVAPLADIEIVRLDGSAKPVSLKAEGKDLGGGNNEPAEEIGLKIYAKNGLAATGAVGLSKTGIVNAIGGTEATFGGDGIQIEYEIKAVKAGKVNLTIKDLKGKTASFALTVTQPVKKVEITNAQAGNDVDKPHVLQRGKTFTLKATVNKDEPAASNKTLRWQVEEETRGVDPAAKGSVATVSAKGVVKAIGDGEATILVSSVDDPSVCDRYYVSVNAQATKVVIEQSKFSMAPGKTVTLSAATTPTMAALSSGKGEGGFTWTANKAGVIDIIGDPTGSTVTVKALTLPASGASQKVKLTVEAAGGKKATIEVTVAKSAQDVVNLRITKTATWLQRGKSETLKVALNEGINPVTKKKHAAPANKNIVWEIEEYTPDGVKVDDSKKGSIATVDAKGKVTAKGYGYAIVTAKPVCSETENPGSLYRECLVHCSPKP